MVWYGMVWYCLCMTIPPPCVQSNSMFFNQTLHSFWVGLMTTSFCIVSQKILPLLSFTNYLPSLEILLNFKPLFVVCFSKRLILWVVCYGVTGEEWIMGFSKLSVTIGMVINVLYYWVMIKIVNDWSCYRALKSLFF